MALQLTNDLAVKYLVDALNKDVEQVNTLAKKADYVATKAEDDAQTSLTRIENVSETLSGEITRTESLIRSELKQQWRADIVDGVTGEILSQNEILQFVASAISQSASDITFAFEQADALTNTTISSFFQFSPITGLYIGNSESPIRLRLKNDRIELVRFPDANNIDDEPEVVTYWTTDIFASPLAFNIPAGGSFTMGNFRWVPRKATGNLSLVKVN